MGENDGLLKPKLLRLNRRQLQFYAKAGRAKIIFSDGMPRSGSTLVFNIARLILQSDPDRKLSTGWVRDARRLPPADIYLIKTHGLNPVDAWRASRIIYSYRDPRDALVSHARKFGTVPTIDTCRQWIRDFDFAKKHAHLMLRYETAMSDLPRTIDRIAGLLKMPVDTREIAEGLPGDPAKRRGQDKETLFFEGHRTGTEAGDWREVLAPALQSQISEEFGPWLELHGYAAA